MCGLCLQMLQVFPKHPVAIQSMPAINMMTLNCMEDSRQYPISYAMYHVIVYSLIWAYGCYNTQVWW